MRTCERCLLHCDGFCPCRNVKKLFRLRPRNVFMRERTVIVENTVQQCVHNFGNAIYVPTYENGVVEAKGEVMAALGGFLSRLHSEIADVRTFKKCDCDVFGGGFHECRSQSWWSW